MSDLIQIDATTIINRENVAYCIRSGEGWAIYFHGQERYLHRVPDEAIQILMNKGETGNTWKA